MEAASRVSYSVSKVTWCHLVSKVSYLLVTFPSCWHYAMELSNFSFNGCRSNAVIETLWVILLIMFPKKTCPKEMCPISLKLKSLDNTTKGRNTTMYGFLENPLIYTKKIRM